MKRKFRDAGVRVLTGCCLLAVLTATAQALVIDFEGVPTTYYGMYGNQNLGGYYAGLWFGPDATILDRVIGGYNSADYPPHSGNAILYSDLTPYIRVDFVAATAEHVGVWYTSYYSLHLEAYDASGNLLAASVGTSTYPSASRWLAVDAPNIAYVIVHDSGNYFGIDDFTYECNVAPVVTAPAEQTASEGVGQTFALGSFTDPDDDDPWAVSVDWGDGSATTFSAATAGSLGTRTHTYADGGDYTVTVTVTEENGAGASGAASFQVEVSEAMVVPTGGLVLNALEGQVLADVTVAKFSDPTGPDDVSRYAASIAWGDGAVSAATIVPASGGGGGGTPAADVLFLIDTTGSMYSFITNMRTALSGILTAIEARLPGMDIQYAVADYRNYRDGGNYTTYGVNLRQPFTSSATLVQTAINSLSASGGWDWPESQLKAMTTIAANWLTPTGPVGFNGRAVSQKLILWAGDAPGHYYGEGGDGPANYYPSLAGTVAALNAAGIQVIGLDTWGAGDGIDLSYGGQHQETYIATQTGGTALYSVGRGGPSVEDAVVNSIVGEIESTFLVQGSHTYADNGTYNLTITIQHDDLPAVTTHGTAAVGNVNPGLTVGPDQTAREGDLVEVAPARFTDPGFDCATAGTLEDFTAVVTWGDGTAPESVAVEETPGGPGVATTGTLTARHAYADDGSYRVRIRVSDDDSGWVESFFDVYVGNRPPAVDAGPDLEVVEGDTVRLPPALFVDPGTLDTHGATVAWGDGTPTESGVVTESPFGPPGDPGGMEGSVAAEHVYADDGSYRVVVTVADDDGGVGSDTLTVTVRNAAPSVTADVMEQTVQYSDPIAMVTFTATDPSPLDLLTAETSYSVNGGPFQSGLPDAGSLAAELVFAGDADQTSAATWTLSGIADLVPGTYTIRVTVTDDDSGSGWVDVALVVAAEDARVTYAGPLFVSTDPRSPDQALVELRAVVRDISLVSDDPDWDADAGHITMATVTFVNRDNGLVIAAGIPVQLLGPDTGTGVAFCTWPVALGPNDTAISCTIGIIVNDCYTRNTSEDDVVVTVARPSGEFITGGGYLVNEVCAGQCAGAAGLHTNFGFNVKFNRKMTNLQGHFNAIVRLDYGVVLQIKSNAAQSLVVYPDRGIDGAATFVAKANLTDVTDPDAPVGLGGNLTLIVTMTDNGEPGDCDSINFTLWNRNTLLFSTRWEDARPWEQTIAGGNLAVH